LYSRIFFFVVFLSTVCGCFAGGNTRKVSAAEDAWGFGVTNYPLLSNSAELSRNSGDNSSGELPAQAEDFRRGEQVMKALAAAYPDRIGEVLFRDGDWAVRLKVFGAPEEPREKWYYYAGGRLLPEELREKAAEYDPQPFYNYPPSLPPWKEPSPGDADRLRAQASRRRQNPPRRSQHFYDDLWRAHSRGESWDRVKSMRFLGHSVLVHYSILEDLALVEERILAEAASNPQIKQWINGLDSMDGWNWRSIAETQSRSFHAYGAALDMLPKSLGGRETYWIWTARKTPEWWTVSYDRRFHPPDAVIQAFEAQGFIWGGKWLFFDTMHFEYRPEILIFNNLPLPELR
jgi:hypothetical protein